MKLFLYHNAPPKGWVMKYQMTIAVNKQFTQKLPKCLFYTSGFQIPQMRLNNAHIYQPAKLQTWRDKWEEVFCATTGSTACMLQSTWHFASFLNWFTFSNIKYQQNFSLKFKIKSYSAFLLPFLKEYHSGIWCNKTDLVIQYPM